MNVYNIINKIKWIGWLEIKITVIYKIDKKKIMQIIDNRLSNNDNRQ